MDHMTRLRGVIPHGTELFQAFYRLWLVRFELFANVYGISPVGFVDFALFFLGLVCSSTDIFRDLDGSRMRMPLSVASV